MWWREAGAGVVVSGPQSTGRCWGEVKGASRVSMRRQHQSSQYVLGSWAGAGGTCLPPTQGTGRTLGEFCRLESCSSSRAAPLSWCGGWHALLASGF